MIALQGAASANPDSAIENLRPHCQSVGACVARTPGKHCVRCTSASPATRGRKSAGILAVFAARPELARRRAEQLQAICKDPAVAERKRVSMLAAHARPETKERHRAGVREANARRLSTEEGRRLHREAARRGGLAAGGKEARDRARATKRETYLAWCPAEYHAFDQSLKRNGYRLPERKRLVAQAITVDARKAVQARAAAMQAKHARELAQAY